MDDFLLINKVGEGAFSEVYKMKDKKTGKLVAVKILNKKYSSLTEAMNCDELITMKKLDYHPNVINFLDAIYDQLTGQLSIIFPLMDMNMYDYIQNCKRRLSEIRAQHFLYQLILAIHFLHKNSIFHRDIKPENILVRINKELRNHQYKCELIQLADLGSVCDIRSLQPYSAYVSTRWYRAPECILTSGYYTSKIDIWALGCVFYEMLTLTPLFPGDSELDQLHKIHDIIGSPNKRLLSRFKNINVQYAFPLKKAIGLDNLLPMLSGNGIDILNKTLMYHPDMRSDIYKLMNHPYFDDLRSSLRIGNNKSSVSLPSTRSEKVVVNSRYHEHHQREQEKSAWQQKDHHQQAATLQKQGKATELKLKKNMNNNHLIRDYSIESIRGRVESHRSNVTIKSLDSFISAERLIEFQYGLRLKHNRERIWGMNPGPKKEELINKLKCDKKRIT